MSTRVKTNLHKIIIISILNKPPTPGNAASTHLDWHKGKHLQMENAVFRYIIKKKSLCHTHPRSVIIVGLASSILVDNRQAIPRSQFFFLRATSWVQVRLLSLDSNSHSMATVWCKTIRGSVVLRQRVRRDLLCSRI